MCTYVCHVRLPRFRVCGGEMGERGTMKLVPLAKLPHAGVELRETDKIALCERERLWSRSFYSLSTVGLELSTEEYQVEEIVSDFLP